MGLNFPWLRRRQSAPEDLSAPEDTCRIQLDSEEASTRSFYMRRMGGADFVVSQAAGGWRLFETPLPAVFLACAVRWPGRFIDVGANTGFYSFLALCADDVSTVLAFEPDKDALKIFGENACLNSFGGRLKIRPAALSDRVGEGKLYVPLKDHGLVETSSSLEEGFKPAHSEVLTVSVETLDRVALEGPPVSLIKIDVEAHEKQVIAGGEGVLARHRPLVAVEMLDAADYGYFTALRDRLGYRSVRLRAEKAVEERAMEWDFGAWNHVLVPEEKWEAFRAMLDVLLL